MLCEVCGFELTEEVYRGPIRIGRFGEYSETEHVVSLCGYCGVACLQGEGFDYTCDEYRLAVDGAAEVENFYHLHDGQQADQLLRLGTSNLRGKVVADVGCGGGSFLDYVQGVARETIAIEPFTGYHEHLKHRHRVYSRTRDALVNEKERVDLAVCFAVLEHVENPLPFLEEIYSLLKPGAQLFLSTPNLDDWLIEFLPGEYDKFFFRKAHKWYFDASALRWLANEAGFSEVAVEYAQRFDVSNMLHWLRDRRPTGLEKSSILNALDGQYKDILEKSGRADFIYARFTKG